MKYNVVIDPRIKIKNLEEHCNIPIYIRFTGDVSEESAEKFCEELEGAEDMALRSGQSIIPIVINSYGGDVYALFSMVDQINSCKVPVATIVEGKAMSAGAVLFTCGAEGHRYIAPNATLMIHEVSSWSGGKNEEIKASSIEVDRLNERLMKLMAKNCGKKDNYFIDLVHEKRHADWFLTPQECLQHNIATVIGCPGFEVTFSMDSKFGL
jgi:ATP-dependent Clp protease protease subunit